MKRKDDHAHRYGGTLMCDMLDVLNICIERHKQGLEGYEKLGERVAWFIRTLRHNGYTPIETLERVTDRVVIDVDKALDVYG